MPDEKNLQDELKAAAAALEELIDKCPVGPEKTALRDQLDEIIKKQKQLAAAKIKEEGLRYDEALKALRQANSTIADSIRSCDNFDKAVTHVATALDAIARMFA